MKEKPSVLRIIAAVCSIAILLLALSNIIWVSGGMSKQVEHITDDVDKLKASDIKDGEQLAAIQQKVDMIYDILKDMR